MHAPIFGRTYGVPPRDFRKSPHRHTGKKSEFLRVVWDTAQSPGTLEAGQRT
jgi:hypothetical protein